MQEAFLLRTSPSQAEFDRHAHGYHDQLDQALQKWGKTSGLYVAKAKIRQLLTFMKQRQIPLGNLRILDVGCGTGLIAGMLEREGPKLYGVDLSHSMIVHNKTEAESAEQKFLVSSAAQLPFAANSFDYTFSVCVFHHLSDAERVQAVHEMVRVTKPSGFIIIFEHNPLNPLTRLVVACCPLDRNARLLFPYHVRRLYQQVGLEAIEQRYFLFFPEFLSALNCFEPHLAKVPMGAQYFVAGRKGAAI